MANFNLPNNLNNMVKQHEILLNRQPQNQKTEETQANPLEIFHQKARFMAYKSSFETGAMSTADFLGKLTELGISYTQDGSMINFEYQGKQYSLSTIGAALAGTLEGEASSKSGSGDIVLADWTKADSRSAGETVKKALEEVKKLIQQLADKLKAEGYDQETIDHAVTTATNYYTALFTNIYDDDNGMHKSGETCNVNTTYRDAFGNKQELSTNYNHIARDNANRMYEDSNSGGTSGVILAENTGSGHSYRLTIDPGKLAQTFAGIVADTEAALGAEDAQVESKAETNEPEYTSGDLKADDLIAQLPVEGGGKAGSGDVVLSNWTKAKSKDESATVDKGQAALAEYIQQLGDYLIAQGYDKATVEATVTTMTNYYTALLDQVDDNDNGLHKKGEHNNINTTYVDAFGNEQKLESSYNHVARDNGNKMYKDTHDGKDSGVILAENTGSNHSYKLTIDPNALVNKFIENFKLNEVALNNGVDGVVDGQTSRAENMGDGSLITALTALGQTEAGAQLIKEAITNNPDGSVTIKFHGKDPVTVTAEEILKHDTDDVATDMYSNGDNDYLVVEIAMQKLGIADLSDSIKIETVFELLTGERTHTTKDAAEFLEQISKRGLEDTAAFVTLDVNLAYDAITVDGERWSYESPDRGDKASNALAITNITDETVTIKDTYNNPVKEYTISREQFEEWDIVNAGYVDLPDVKTPEAPVEPEVEPEVVPDVTPEVVPDVKDDTTVGGDVNVPDAEPEIVPDVEPEVIPEQNPSVPDAEPEVVPEEPTGPSIRDVDWANLLAKFPVEGAGKDGSGDIVLTGYNKAKSKSAEGTVDQAQKNLEMYIEEIGEYLIEQGFDKETVDAAVTTLTNYYNALMEQVHDDDNRIHRNGEHNNVSTTYVDAFGNEQKLESSYNHVARDAANLMYKGTKEGYDSGVILAENTGSNHSYRVTIDPNTLLNKFMETFEATEKAMSEPEVKDEVNVNDNIDINVPETPETPEADEVPEVDDDAKVQETKTTLEQAMKDMHLRDTYCSGVYCPAMPNADGTREHYVWDDTNGKMVSVGTYTHVDADGAQLKDNANYQAYLQGYSFTETDGVYEKDGKEYKFENGKFVEIKDDIEMNPLPTRPIINPNINFGFSRPIVGINPPTSGIINPQPIGDLPKINVNNWQIKQYTDYNDKI